MSHQKAIDGLIAAFNGMDENQAKDLLKRLPEQVSRSKMTSRLSFRDAEQGSSRTRSTRPQTRTAAEPEAYHSR